jgi:hypothetical protein
MNDKFEVKMKKETFFSDYPEVYISITHNGYQWDSLRFENMGEVREVLKELMKFVAEDNRKVAEEVFGTKNL